MLSPAASVAPRECERQASSGFPGVDANGPARAPLLVAARIVGDEAPLVAPHLERGTLVALFEPPVAAPARYFLAVASGSGEKPEARAFLDWLRAETGKSGVVGKAAVETVSDGER